MTLLRVLPHLHIQQSSLARTLPPTHLRGLHALHAQLDCEVDRHLHIRPQLQTFQPFTLIFVKQNLNNQTNEILHTSNSGLRNLFLRSCLLTCLKLTSFLKNGGMTTVSIRFGCCSLVTLNVYSLGNYHPKQSREKVQENSTAAPCLLTIYSLSFYFSFANELVSEL